MNIDYNKMITRDNPNILDIGPYEGQELDKVFIDD